LGADKISRPKKQDKKVRIWYNFGTVSHEIPILFRMNRFFLISPLVLQTLIWPITRPVFRFFLHLKIDGVENLKSVTNNHGLIFACNHSSELDPILVPASLPFLSRLMPMFYTSREQKFYQNSGWRQIFYGGLFFKIWGSHALHSGKHNYAESLQDHIKILGHGKSLLIFPEGRKTKDGQMQEGHGGVAFLSHTLDIPIVPVHISGHFQISLSDFLLRRRHVKVAFGKAMNQSDVFAGIQSPSSPDGNAEYFKSAAQSVMLEISKLG